MYNIKYNIGQKVKYKEAVYEDIEGDYTYIKDIVKEGFIFCIEIDKDYKKPTISIRYKVKKELDKFAWDYVIEKNIIAVLN